MYIKDDEINKYFNEPNWKVAHNLFQQYLTCLLLKMVKFTKS